MTTTSPRLFEQVIRRVRQADVFDRIHTDPAAPGLRCDARGAQSEATYRAMLDPARNDTIWIGLYTPDRWLSESIEADLLHTGDKMEDLLEEELVEHGLETWLPIEHFRDDDKQFVFRSSLQCQHGEAIDSDMMIDRVVKALLAYEACFRELGEYEAGRPRGLTGG